MTKEMRNENYTSVMSYFSINLTHACSVLTLSWQMKWQLEKDIVVLGDT